MLTAYLIKTVSYDGHGSKSPSNQFHFSQKYSSLELMNNQSVALQKVIKNPHMFLMACCSPVKISKTKSLSTSVFRKTFKLVEVS